MPRIIVTAGEKYADIDVLACAVAYAELLRLEGKDAVAVVSKNFQASITPTVLSWGGVYETTYEARGDDDYVLVDMSEIQYAAAFVKRERVRELFDHHFYGREQEWYDQLHDNAHIEHVGACATLIWEQVVVRGQADALSLASKRLLCAAIVSNSLNLTAAVTDARDHVALNDIELRADLPSDWRAQYFEEQEHYLETNLVGLLSSDTKDLPLKDGSVIVIGQLELWHAESFIKRHLDEITRALATRGYERWFLTAPSISEGKNYLYTTDEKTKSFLANTLSVHFDNNIACTERLMMRKEIIPLITGNVR